MKCVHVDDGGLSCLQLLLHRLCNALDCYKLPAGIMNSLFHSVNWWLGCTSTGPNRARANGASLIGGGVEGEEANKNDDRRNEWNSTNFFPMHCSDVCQHLLHSGATIFPPPAITILSDSG